MIWTLLVSVIEQEEDSSDNGDEVEGEGEEILNESYFEVCQVLFAGVTDDQRVPSLLNRWSGAINAFPNRVPDPDPSISRPCATSEVIPWPRRTWSEGGRSRSALVRPGFKMLCTNLIEQVV